MKHKHTKALSWLLSLALMLSLVPGMSMTAYAETPTWESGDCIVTLLEGTTLTVSKKTTGGNGSGAMGNYRYNSKAPWANYLGNVQSVVVESGVTSIGDFAFYDKLAAQPSEATGIETVTIPEGVTKIGQYAFYASSKLTHVTIPGSVTEIGDYAFYLFDNEPTNPLFEVTFAPPSADQELKIGLYSFLGASSKSQVTVAFAQGTATLFDGDNTINKGSSAMALNSKTLTWKSPHTHNDIAFTAWTSADSLPTDAGSYYLTKDVTIESTWNVPTGETNLCLNGHGIHGLVTVEGTLNLYDCDTQTEHKYTVDANGIATINDTLTESYQTFTGGYITGNSSSDHERCIVSVRGEGTKFNMHGGTIIGNHGDEYGGYGVCVENEATMSGGNIMYNKTGVNNSGSFTMTGGSIHHNRGNYGGIRNNGSFTITGGTIHDNTGTYVGGIANNGTVYFSGNPNITGNKKGGTDCNVYFYSDTEYRTPRITIKGELENTARVGVTMATPGVFTSSGETKAKDYLANFASDDSTYAVKTDGDELKLDLPHTHAFTYAADGATITATCSNTDDCPLADSNYQATLTVVAPTLTTYGETGKSAAATLDADELTAFNTATGKTVAATDIKYVGRDGTTYAESATAPTGAGKYTAKITVEGRTAQVNYEIAKATISPTVSLDGWTYGEAAKTPSVTGNTGSGGVTYTYAVKDGAEFKSDIPVNAGEYTVKATIAATTNYSEATATANFTIAKVPAPAITADQKPTADGASVVGYAVSLVKAPKEAVPNYTVMYSLDGENWSQEIPHTTRSGRYDVFVRYDCDDNHTPFAGDTVYVSTILGVVYSDESVLGKHDGRIYPIPSDVVYKAENDTEYQHATHEFTEDGTVYYDVVDLAPGKYYFHYVKSGKYPEGPDNFVTIEEGKPITVRYISEGEVIEELTGLTYGTKLTKPADPVREGYKFVGWFYRDSLWSFDNELDSIGDYDFETDKYYYKIEAKWTRQNIVNGVITDQDNKPIEGAFVRLDEESTFTNVNGEFAFIVDDGYYEIFASHESGSVTRCIKVTDDTKVDIQLNAGVCSAVDNNFADRYAALVDGLDKIADKQTPQTGETVAIELAVIAEDKVDDSDKSAFKANKDAIKALDEAKGKQVEFFELSLRKIVRTEGNDDVISNIGGGNSQLLTIVIPYNMNRKTDITVYRYHDGAIAMKKDPADGEEGFTVGEGTITIYAKKFSTYAIGYTALSGGGSGGSGSSSKPVPKAGCPQDETCPISKFTDAGAKAWYHDGVHWALENGVMNGVDKALFAPNGDTSRAMIVVMLWRLEGSPAYVGMSEFSDVENTDWYGAAVRWASAEGIVLGYDNGKFGPNDAVTREQLAAILYRYAQYKKQDVSVGEDTNILSYDDALTVREYAIPAMQWACGAGIISGIDSNLVPAGNASRAQVATMLMRYNTAK